MSKVYAVMYENSDNPFARRIISIHSTEQSAKAALTPDGWCKIDPENGELAASANEVGDTMWVEEHEVL